MVVDSNHVKVWVLPDIRWEGDVTVQLKTKTIRSSDLTVVERAKWAAKTKPDSAIYNAVSLSIGSKGYLLTGSDSTYSYSIYGNEPLTIIGGARNRCLEYDPATDSWKRLPDFPGGNRVAAAGFSIGTKAYIGTGSDWRGHSIQTSGPTIRRQGFGNNCRICPPKPVITPLGSMLATKVISVQVSGARIPGSVIYGNSIRRETAGRKWPTSPAAALCCCRDRAGQ